MMLYARSCERPSKSSASVFLPSSVSKMYSFSTGTHGSSRRFSVTFWPSSPCSASSFASSSRAACHSSRVPTLCAVMCLPFPGFTSYDEASPPNSSHREELAPAFFVVEEGDADDLPIAEAHIPAVIDRDLGSAAAPDVDLVYPHQDAITDAPGPKDLRRDALPHRRSFGPGASVI